MNLKIIIIGYALAAFACGVAAQTFPSKPVRILEALRLLTVAKADSSHRGCLIGPYTGLTACVCPIDVLQHCPSNSACQAHNAASRQSLYFQQKVNTVLRLDCLTRQP